MTPCTRPMLCRFSLRAKPCMCSGTRMVFCPEPCCALCIVSHEARDAIAVEKLVTTGPMRSQEVSKTRLSAQVNTRRRGRGAFRLSSVTRKRPTRKRQLTQQVPRRTHNAHSKCEHKPPCLDFYAIKQRKQKLAHNNTRMHAATHTHTKPHGACADHPSRVTGTKPGSRGPARKVVDLWGLQTCHQCS